MRHRPTRVGRAMPCRAAPRWRLAMNVRAGFALGPRLLGAHGSWSRQGAASGFERCAQGAGQCSVVRRGPGCNPGPNRPSGHRSGSRLVRAPFERHPRRDPVHDPPGTEHDAPMGRDVSLSLHAAGHQAERPSCRPEGTMTVAPMSTRRTPSSSADRASGRSNVIVELPAVVRIKGNTGDWKRLLIQALGDPTARTSTRSPP